MRTGFVAVKQLPLAWKLVEPGRTLLKIIGLVQLNIMLIAFKLEPFICIQFIWGVVNYQNSRYTQFKV